MCVIFKMLPFCDLSVSAFICFNRFSEVALAVPFFNIGLVVEPSDEINALFFSLTTSLSSWDRDVWGRSVGSEILKKI